MKLKNKRTGEIRPAEAREDGIYLYDETTEQWYKYELGLLAEGWEYYEEPKEYWGITAWGDVYEYSQSQFAIKQKQTIGNYFTTKEEAEKAVEKLKAIKILKDYDLHIEWANTPEYNEDYDEWCCSVDFRVRGGCDGDKLFDLLFGGGE